EKGDFIIMLRHPNKLQLSCIILVLTLLLSACGQGKQTSSPSTEGNSALQTETSTDTALESATRVYKDALGREVTIPAHPQRVLTTQYLPEMLAAGLKPAGAASHLLNNYVSIQDQLEGIEDIGVSNKLNLEKALELQPDLIIAAEWNEDQLEQLSKIAPTVVVQWEGADAFQHFKSVADVIGRSEQAQEWIQAFNQKSEEARTKLSSFVSPDETFGVVVIGGFEKGQLRVYGNANVGYTLYDALKFNMTDTVKEEWAKGNHELGINISLEKLPEYASADRLFVVRFDNDPDFLKEVDDSQLWHSLPAVKNNKVYVVDESLWFSYDVMSLSAQLDDAVQLLTK
ncbi:ABC transporter substrate-binding protein, partial [Paenibacillus taichungensis]